MRPVPWTTLYRAEYINSIDYAANSERNLPGEGGSLPRNRHLWGLMLRVRGRATMPSSGGPSGLIGPEGILGLIERVVVEGFYVPQGTNERIVDLRAADLYWLNTLYLPRVSAPTPDPSSWDFTGGHSNDFQFTLILPFVPLGVSPFEQARYLLDAPNYNPLKLTIRWADPASVFGSYTTAPTLTAYGSSSGNPTCEVTGIFALGGKDRFAGTLPGRLWRYFQDVTDAARTTANGVRIIDLPKGYFLRHIIIKTGRVASGTSSGNTAFSSLGDVLTEINLYRGLNTPVRRWFRQADIRELFKLAQANAYADIPSGIAPIDFALSGALGESFSARNLVAGPSGTVDFYLSGNVTGYSNGLFTFIYEEIRRLPVGAGR